MCLVNYLAPSETKLCLHPVRNDAGFHNRTRQNFAISVDSGFQEILEIMSGHIHFLWYSPLEIIGCAKICRNVCQSVQIRKSETL